eukprot:926942-Pyramimonas_sp.AAC.1
MCNCRCAGTYIAVAACRRCPVFPTELVISFLVLYAAATSFDTMTPRNCHEIRFPNALRPHLHLGRRGRAGQSICSVAALHTCVGVVH